MNYATRNLPSTKTIKDRLACSAETAKKVRDVLEDAHPLTSGKITRALDTIDDLIGGFGREFIGNGRQGVSYINMGDTYANTVLYDYKAERFLVGCWGDIVEREPKRFD